MHLVIARTNLTARLKRYAVSSIFLLFFFAFGLARGWSQLDTGTIIGAVHDGQGAAVVGASVTIRNVATGVAATTRTNNDGTYQVLSLIPGTYSVVATAQGFTPARNPSVEIHVQSRAQVDFTLGVVAVQEQIEVNASGVELQTQSAEAGLVVGAQQINDLPLNSRRYADLALLSPGIFKNPSVANSAPDRFSSNGNSETQNYFALDGVDNNSGSTNLQEGSVQNVQPPPDAIQEFRLQTRTYSTEFGTSAGAVVNASVKSGTNQFHGDVFEFARNSVLDSNTYFNRQKGIRKGTFSQNQFGGTIGGPIFRDHTFFFGDYQGLRSSTDVTAFSVVPSAKMKTGDFTELAVDSNGKPTNDPNKYAYKLQSLATGQTGCIDYHVSMVISPSCLDPVGVKLASLYPDPNDPNVPVWTGAPNYNYVFRSPAQNNSADLRIDHKLRENDMIFGRYSFLQQHRQNPLWTSNPIAGNGNSGADYAIRNQGLALGWTHVLSATAVNQARFGFLRDNAHSNPIGLTLGASNAPDYGLTGIPASPYTAGVPPIWISDFVNLGVSRYRPQFQVSQVFQFIDNFTKLIGQHSLMFGYQYHRNSDNFLDLQAPQGFMQSTGIYANKQGFGFADFLLGDIASTIYNTPLDVHQFLPGHSFFAEDTWRVAKNLTVNYGLRYELYAPMLNRTNAVANFSPANGGSLVTAAAGAQSWQDRSLIKPDKNSFAPRFGFSYQPAGNIVFRGGYGVFYQFINRIGSEAQLSLNQPFLKAVQVTQSSGSVTPVFQLKNGFPGATYAGSVVPLYLQKNNWQDPNQRTSYVQQASFGPQVQVSSNTVMELTWVGNWGRKMNRLRNANQGQVIGYNSPKQAIVQFPYANLNTATTVIAGAGQHSFLEYATNDGNTSYHALEASLRRQYMRGLGYQISYTWAHNMSDFVDNLTGNSTPQNAYDYAHEKSNSPFDQKHRFVASGLWKLPFGKDGLIMANDSKAARLLGNWQLNGILTLQTGLPMNITAPDSSQTGGNHAAYANCVANPFAGTTTNRAAISTPSPAPGVFISPSGFSIPTAGTFGTCRPRLFHGPGARNVDLSLFKQFPLGDERKFELRFEFFNAFNHANFANPATNMSNTATFGKVTSTINDPRQIQLAGKFYF
ncbi:TonB-dependent receptor [Edaphobacter bradus]|uniref:TonB-dependent receptor n=1 Tax=Edaphobacter bradus TaxID=2259016 RepID=UPI0021DF56D2|nr:TonB-dependent receptor [Edaphobacter bradus]